MAITLEDLRGDRRRVRTERNVRLLLTAAAATSILISALIVRRRIDRLDLVSVLKTRE